MNSHNQHDHDPFDAFIGRCLKNWLQRQNPPAHARERLLHAASSDLHGRSVSFPFWLPLLHSLIHRITSGSTFVHEQSQHSIASHDAVAINGHFDILSAYQLVTRALPGARGLIFFLS